MSSKVGVPVVGEGIGDGADFFHGETLHICGLGMMYEELSPQTMNHIQMTNISFSCGVGVVEMYMSRKLSVELCPVTVVITYS